MNKFLSQTWQPIEKILPWLVLSVLLAYTYAFFFAAPYTGFYFNPANGQVLIIYVKNEPAAALQVGDMIQKIGSVSLSDYAQNATQIFFKGALPGQVIEINILRDKLPITIPWVFPGFNGRELVARLFDIWWLEYIFWFLGIAAQLFIRPKSTCWRLFIAANYLTSCWLLFGTLSSRQIWSSSVLFHSVTWLAMPVYLDLHWNFPKPLGRVSPIVRVVLYLASGLFAVAQFMQFLPRSFYLLGFLILLVGSIILLSIHYAKQPEQRRDLGLIALAVLIALAPSISLAIAGLFGALPTVSPLALFALPIMPGAYFYAVYRRQLGGLELRTNRIITLFIYGALLLTVCIPMTFMINAWFMDPGTAITVELFLTLLVSLITAIIYPYFQRWVERRILDIPLPPAKVLELYAARIVTSMEINQLRRVICDEVLPSLLVRQAALLQLDDALNPTPVCLLGLAETQIPKTKEIPALLSEQGKPRPPMSGGAYDLVCPWMRLVLPLTIEGRLIGLCLLGRRDPDDFYAATEIPTLQALMDQTALALVNIQQAEHLHALYKADIERHEAERNHLALELHDDVLGQMALLAMSADDNVTSTQFDQAYQAATEHIRQIIDGLHPTMLNYGLQPALDELAEELGEMSPAAVIRLDLLPNDVRYPPMTELHLFRIIQQACQNSLQHAQARNICITGNLQPEEAELVVEDDGIGFPSGEHLDLPGLLANKHFGLAGMFERAALIGAKMTVATSPGKGTRTCVTWHSEKVPA